MKTIINYFLLSFLIPITIILTVGLLLLQLLHWTAFNPNFYKSTLQQANIYSMLESEGTWSTFIKTAKFLPNINIQNEVEQSIDSSFSFIKDKQNYVTKTKMLSLVENDEKVLRKRLEPIKFVYLITLTILKWLYALVPLLALATGWLFIKSWLHFLKSLATWSFILGIFITILAGISTNYISTVLAYLLPNLILGLDLQTIITALTNPLYRLFQQIMLSGIILTILGVIIQIYIYWTKRSGQNIEKTLPNHASVTGQKNMPVVIQNKKNNGVNPFDPRTFK